MTDDLNKKIRERFRREDDLIDEDCGYNLWFLQDIEIFLEMLWHEPSEEPEQEKNIVMQRTSEPPFAGKYLGSHLKIDGKVWWDVYNGYVCQEILPSKWCYLEDISYD